MPHHNLLRCLKPLEPLEDTNFAYGPSISWGLVQAPKVPTKASDDVTRNLWYLWCASGQAVWKVV